MAVLLSALALEVAFQQHMGGNHIPRCSKCHFMIAWAAAGVANFIRRQMGAFQKSLSVNSQGDTRGMTGCKGARGTSRVSSARGNRSLPDNIWRCEMKKITKSLLLGTAAGLVAVAGAQAADMPVKAAPVQYVKICTLYGDGFYYIPGTDTCLKMGGYLRVQAEYNMGAGGVAVGDGATRGRAGPLHPRHYQRHQLPRPRGDLVGRPPADRIRHAAHLYPLRSREHHAGATGAGTTFNPFWDRAFIQFAGFTVGRSQSFFDLFTYGGAYSYHNVRVSGDTGASGQNLWAYTAQFGNGFSGTLSLEDPATRKAGTVDIGNAGFFASRPPRRHRQRAPTIQDIAQAPALRLPGAGPHRQPARRSGLGLCRHQRRLARCQRRLLRQRRDASTPSQPVTTAIPPTSTAGRPRPAPSSTWRAATRSASTSATREGAAGLLHQPAKSAALQLQHQPGVGWLADGVFAPAPTSSSPGPGALSPSTSTSGTRDGGPRSSAATSMSTTTASPPTSSIRQLPAGSRLRAAGRRGSVRQPLSTSTRSPATAAAPTSASVKSARARSGTRCRSSISVSK